MKGELISLVNEAPFIVNREVNGVVNVAWEGVCKRMGQPWPQSAHSPPLP